MATISQKPPARVKEFLNAIFQNCEEGQVEYRFIAPDKSVTREFRSLNNLLLPYLPNDKNCYFGVATRDGQGGKKENIFQIPALWVDLDFKVLPKEEAKKRLSEFPLKPSVVINSGGGYHVYWLMKEPFEKASIPHVEAYLKRLAGYLGGDMAVTDASHVLRLAGTWNVKPVYSEPRPVNIVKMDDSIQYNPDDFDFLPELEQKFKPGLSPNHELIDINDLVGEAPECRANEFKSVPDPITKILSHCQYLNGLHVKTKELHHLEHEERIHFANVFLPLQGGREWLHEVYSTLSDYDREFTDKQLESLHARPTRCITMCKMLCPAITGRGGKSPVAFAYPKKTQDTGKKIELTSLADLFNEPAEMSTWLVDGLLPAGGLSILAGKPKAGKSTLARNLALRVALGEPFLDRPIEKGRVIYLALEEKRSEVRKHFRDMGAVGSEDILIFASSAPLDAIAQIMTIAKELKPSLLIIDPLFRLARVPDANDYAKVTAAMEPLLIIARETGAHLLLVHHMSKGERQNGDSILGSTAIFGSVDTALFLKRSERYRTLSSQQRYGLDLEEVVLGFDQDSRVITAEGSREEQEMGRIKGIIHEFLSVQVSPVSEKDITDGTEGKTTYQRKALRELLGEGKIERIGQGGRYDPFRYIVKNSSCSHVPHIHREHQEHDGKNSANTDKHCAPACSQDFAKNGNFEKNREHDEISGNNYIDLEQGVDFLTGGEANV